MEGEANHSHPGSAHVVYLFIIGALMVALTIVFVSFPRSTYSQLEKRDLMEFPDVSNYEGSASQLTGDISQWFSDSEPYRDHFMTFSMQIRDALGLKVGAAEDQISFKPSASSTQDGLQEIEESIDEPEGNPLSDANAKLSNSGTIVVGSGENVRALMAFGGTATASNAFVRAANKYKETFPELNVYALVAPLATEFYLPEKGAKLSKPQKPVLDNIKNNLSAGVRYVDVYAALAPHTYENIYLRTDHHWAPLGAFYAARALARSAGVPFPELDSYDERTIRRFVGSMYGYTKDIAVKNAPEDFVYYVPKGLDYTSEFVTYNTDKSYRVTSATKPYKADFFRKFKDGSGNAYLTFMGSDQNLVKVVTGTKSPRRVLIVKDSYGNPIPGYLFFSFGEVHVVDFRYFLGSLSDYIRSHGITDIVLAFNVFNACSSGTMGRVERLLNGAPTPAASPEGRQDTDSGKESAPAEPQSPVAPMEPESPSLKIETQEPAAENEEPTPAISAPQEPGED